MNMENMTIEDIIKNLRHCAASEGCGKDCQLYKEYGCYFKLMYAAADALEAAEKRIAQLEEDLKTREAEREVMQDTIKICEEAADRYKAQLPKECEFKSYADKIPNARNRYCTQCGAYLSDEEFENHTIRYCYWCGSKVKGEQK